MIFLVGVIFISSNFFEISAYPLIQPRNLNNDSSYSNNTTAWVNAPKTRGTSDLLLSCLTTLALCAWTAYHPNIHPKTGFLGASFRRLKWMIVAIFLPEWVLYCAWDQRWTAQILRKDINTLSAATDASGKAPAPVNGARPAAENRASSDVEAIGPPGEPEIESEAHQGETPIETHSSPMEHAEYSVTKDFTPWTTQQAFFAVCGGFAVDSSTFWPQQRLTFTPDGLIELARLGLLPDVSAATVADKSKADTGAKALVCIQAGWFLIQTLARLAQRLPVTLLEVHVLAHVVCAFLMYFLWLEKPYDAGHPIVYGGERVRDIAALFAVDSGYSERHRESPTDELTSTRRSSIDIRHIRSAHLSSIKNRSKRLHIKRAFRQNNGNSDPIPNLDQFADDEWYKKNYPRATTPENERKIAEHLRRANRAVALFKATDESAHTDTESVYQPDPPTQPPPQPDSDAHDEPSTPQPETAPEPWTRPRFERPHVVPVCHNHRIDGIGALFTGHSRKGLLSRSAWMVVLLGLFYSGLHLSAWSAHFPSVLESWLWRGSGAAIGALPLLFALLVELSRFPRWLFPADRERRVGMRWLWARRGAAMGLDVVCGMVVMVTAVVSLVYCFARIYVFAEAFASLRSPAKGTYDTVQWISFIPHAG